MAARTRYPRSIVERHIAGAAMRFDRREVQMMRWE